MEKILGLDLGTNSIGWALRDPNLIGNQIEKFGVVTFKKGVGTGKSGEFSFAAERTSKRSTRRLYQARKYRLWKTLEILISEGYCPLTIENLDRWRKYNKEEAIRNNNGGRLYPVNDTAFDQWIKLDFNNDGKPDFKSPYQLRREIAKEALDLNVEANRFKLGRALYHIAQRRGFKSSRKGGDNKNNNDDNSENEIIIDLKYSEKKRNEAIEELFTKYPEAKTIGWLFASLEDDKFRIRENILQHAIRKNFKDEINYIFEVQKLTHDHQLYKLLVETSPNRNNGAIFYKRPLRSQKGLVGKCTLEPNKYRIPISHPEFEFFRAWQFINNIKYKDVNDETSKFTDISFEYKKEIYAKLFLRKSKPYFLFAEIIDHLKNKHRNWVLNFSSKTTVSGCPVTARLKEILGDEFLTVKIKKREATSNGKDYYDLEDIWHMLFSFEDEEKVVDFAEKKLSFNQENVKKLLTAWNSLPVGYGMLCLKAIKKINPFLQKGLPYTDAVLLAKVPDLVGNQLWIKKEKEILDNISKVIDGNRIQKLHLTIVNNLIARYKNSDHKFGYKDNTYELDSSDIADIEDMIKQTYGESRWNNKSEEEKIHALQTITDCYQAFFKVSGLERHDINGSRHFAVKSGNNLFYKSDSGFYHLPKLGESLVVYLQKTFKDQIFPINCLYHPSEISFYPPAEADEDGIIKLGSPVTGAFKNPMAMRTLHELRKLLNYLIETQVINSYTRIVVEVGRELNDSNKRWAIEALQKQRELENKEFDDAIRKLLNKPKDEKIAPIDTDKVRLFYEQTDEEFLPPVISEDQPKNKNSRNKRDVAVRWQGNGKNLINKYKLWIQQGHQCIYTGKYIKLSDLFQENVIDIEHTIPRSLSFDNSLANQTVCFHDYNRTIKKNAIPTKLPNYEKDFGGYSAILPRIAKWIDKVERIKQQIEFWKAKSKKATEKYWKDEAIRQRHLWQMELDYWGNKVNRFTLKEITVGFKNSQKVDTQLISKYAYHYLKSYFEKVDVQKGSITAEFRKIYGLQAYDEKKDRSRHSHHAKDAAVLTLIPIAAKRDEILQTYYEHKERNRNFTNTPYKGFKRDFISQIDELILVNNITKNQSLTPGKKKVRKRGKEIKIPGTNKSMWATGDCIRGQLHEATFYGAIKLPKRNKNGIIETDENGKKLLHDDLKYVLRVPFTVDFDSIEKIVDEGLKNQIKAQILAEGSFKKAFEKGIFLKDKKGNPVGNRIRHIRVWANVAEPLKIKMHTYLSKAEHKQYYYAANGENVYFAIYQGDKKLHFEFRNLYEISQIINSKGINNPELLFEKRISKSKGKKSTDFDLKYILKPGTKVIFAENDQMDKDIRAMPQNMLNKRFYIFTNFEKDGRLNFKYHLEARNKIDEKYVESELDFENPKPTLRFGYSKYRFLVENYEFEVAMDGKIIWKEND